MSKEKKRRPRRKFTEEFKRDAVRLVVVEGYTVGAAAKAVGVSPNSLREDSQFVGGFKLTALRLLWDFRLRFFREIFRLI